MQIPANINILDTSYLANLDDKSIRSINGSRVTERILQLVPNIDTFCVSLRTIKYWARQRGIYSNILGFLGGVNYAIMVAFVCQRYINACPSTIIKKFFILYCQWRWPNPIMLTIYDNEKRNNTTIMHSEWNPKVNPRDNTHLMPIITPCFPAMNSSYNVGLPQFRSIQVTFISFITLLFYY